MRKLPCPICRQPLIESREDGLYIIGRRETCIGCGMTAEVCRDAEGHAFLKILPSTGWDDNADEKEGATNV